MTEGVRGEWFEKGLAKFMKREKAWLAREVRGRWMVVEPGPGRHLKGASQHLRRWIDLATPRRVRRFTSLSRARAFAREFGSEVQRWRRPTKGRARVRVGIWQHAVQQFHGRQTAAWDLWTSARILRLDDLNE